MIMKFKIFEDNKVSSPEDPYDEEDWNDTQHKHIWEDKVERDPMGISPPIDYRECKICGKKYRTHVGYGK